MEARSKIVTKLVGGMIRRTVRQRFRAVYWIPPATPIPQPCVLVANHHGWHDGYMMYVATQALRLAVVDWIQEFEAFPLFAYVGGMPFPADSAPVRAATVLKTIRRMRAGETNLVLFAEGVLHRPPHLLPLGKSLATVSRHVPGVHIVPVAIVYELSLHERPEGYMNFGAPFMAEADVVDRTHTELQSLLETTRQTISNAGESFEVLAKGTRDVNERWSLKRR